MSALPNDPTPSDGGRDPGIDFLLAEVETVRAFAFQADNGSERRVDVLLAIASAFGAGLVILWQSSKTATVFPYVVLIAAISLLAVGIPIFLETIHNELTLVKHIRSLNLLRNYFATHYPHIVPALSLPRNYFHPPFRGFAGSHVVPMVVNALAFSAVGTVGCLLIFGGSLSLDAVSVSSGAIAFGVGILLEALYAAIRYRAASQRWPDRHD